MDYKELLKKYNILLKENNILKAKLQEIQTDISSNKNNIQDEQPILENQPLNKSQFPKINNKSDSISKIKLFMSLFKGRGDVYATQWKNKKKEKSGYSPVCLNQWQSGICYKPNISCSKCKNKSYAALDEYVVEEHLRGNIVAGIYPMLPDESCYFLAMDFDEEGWKNDVSTVRKVCDEFNIPVAVERS